METVMKRLTQNDPFFSVSHPHEVSSWTTDGSFKVPVLPTPSTENAQSKENEISLRTDASMLTIRDRRAARAEAEIHASVRRERDKASMRWRLNPSVAADVAFPYTHVPLIQYLKEPLPIEPRHNRMLEPGESHTLMGFVDEVTVSTTIGNVSPESSHVASTVSETPQSSNVGATKRTRAALSQSATKKEALPPRPNLITSRGYRLKELPWYRPLKYFMYHLLSLEDMYNLVRWMETHNLRGSFSEHGGPEFLTCVSAYVAEHHKDIRSIDVPTLQAAMGSLFSDVAPKDWTIALKEAKKGCQGAKSEADARIMLARFLEKCDIVCMHGERYVQAVDKDKRDRIRAMMQKRGMPIKKRATVGTKDAVEIDSEVSQFESEIEDKDEWLQLEEEEEARRPVVVISPGQQEEEEELTDGIVPAPSGNRILKHFLSTKTFEERRRPERIKAPSLAAANLAYFRSFWRDVEEGKAFLRGETGELAKLIETSFDNDECARKRKFCRVCGFERFADAWDSDEENEPKRRKRGRPSNAEIEAKRLRQLRRKQKPDDLSDHTTGLLVTCTRCGLHQHCGCMDPPRRGMPEELRENWLCSSCKVCSQCGKADNEDAMLVCDRCDRGFHMDCLDPPIDEIPEGDWLCGDCQKGHRFGKSKGGSSKKRRI
jgi:hypothetical protein